MDLSRSRMLTHRTSWGRTLFAFEDSGYFGYGDLNTERRWVYLGDSLAVGTEFTLQIVPDLADDIWLYGRIWSIGDRSVNGVTWHNVVECMYAFDFGVQEAVDEDGNIVDYFHSYIYGTTLFVPEVGPIACDERHMLAPDGVLQDAPPSYDIVVRLAGPVN